MDFSIITPSYRSSQWLRLCVASVADQEGVTHEHIVQDAGSDDGTQDWLSQDKRVKAFIEKDGRTLLMQLVFSARPITIRPG